MIVYPKICGREGFLVNKSLLSMLRKFKTIDREVYLGLQVYRLRRSTFCYNESICEDNLLFHYLKPNCQVDQKPKLNTPSSFRISSISIHLPISDL